MSCLLPGAITLSFRWVRPFRTLSQHSRFIGGELNFLIHCMIKVSVLIVLFFWPHWWSGFRWHCDNAYKNGRRDWIYILFTTAILSKAFCGFTQVLWMTSLTHIEVVRRHFWVMWLLHLPIKSPVERRSITYHELTMQKDADFILFLKLTEHVNNQ